VLNQYVAHLVDIAIGCTICVLFGSGLFADSAPPWVFTADGSAIGMQSGSVAFFSPQPSADKERSNNLAKSFSTAHQPQSADKVGITASLTTTADDPHAIVRGMTISCQSWGWEWGTDEMVATMRELKAMGINWIAIHPYAGIRADGTVSSRHIDNEIETPNWLARPIHEAHNLGLKIMIKPHLAYWGSPFRWRGNIEFETEEQWDQFFTTYGQWVSKLAELCRDADAFVVGTELDKTIAHEKKWREVIADVRRNFPGPITYAANWDRYQNVQFWDALDVIGIQAYFPLLEKNDDEDEHREPPSASELDAGWARIMKDLHAFSERTGKKIAFTELGYNESAQAPYEPWDHRQGGHMAPEIQSLCLDRALRAIQREPDVTGAFLWKWFPGSTQRGNFAQARPNTRKVISENWSQDN